MNWGAVDYPDISNGHTADLAHIRFVQLQIAIIVPCSVLVTAVVAHSDILASLEDLFVCILVPVFATVCTSEPWCTADGGM